MKTFPRSVKDGKAVAAGASLYFLRVNDYDKLEVIGLPSDHIDFLGPVKIIGQTKEDILKEARVYSLPAYDEFRKNVLEIDSQLQELLVKF